MHKGRLRVLNPAGEGVGERSADHPEEGDGVVPEGDLFGRCWRQKGDSEGCRCWAQDPGIVEIWGSCVCTVRLGYGQRERGTVTGVTGALVAE